MDTETEGFSPQIQIKCMPALVAVAMMVQCDKDLTCVHVHRLTTRWSGIKNGERVVVADPELRCCLNCAFLHITGYHLDDRGMSEKWSEVLLSRLNTPSAIITAVRLFENGETCPHCRSFIP